jgi:hypothetical protein
VTLTLLAAHGHDEEVAMRATADTGAHAGRHLPAQVESQGH